MTVIVTHNDLDGFVAKELLMEYGGLPEEEDAIVFTVGYDFDSSCLFSLDGNQNLYVLDYSFTPDVFVKLKNHFNNVIWIARIEVLS